MAQRLKLSFLWIVCLVHITSHHFCHWPLMIFWSKNSYFQNQMMTMIILIMMMRRRPGLRLPTWNVGMWQEHCSNMSPTLIIVIIIVVVVIAVIINVLVLATTMQSSTSSFQAVAFFIKAVPCSLFPGLAQSPPTPNWALQSYCWDFWILRQSEKLPDISKVSCEANIFS